MAIFKKLVGYTKRYSENTAGAMAMAWGVTLAGLTFTIGASYDLTQVSKAKAIAQVAADNMALTASIAVDFGNEDRFVEGQEYSYTFLGGPKEDFTRSMVGSVEYNIIDDQDPANADLPDGDKKRLLARATVTGSYKPAFMSIAPWITGVEFQAVSDVAYAQRQGTPASIFFVTDNSGSMTSHDAYGVRKINSLEASMNEFMGVLGAINTRGERIFRTALFPYNSNLIDYKVVSPDWGILSTSDINAMGASGGTRSTNALIRAKQKFDLENDIHDDENYEENPLKFLIFMSDGANNGARIREVCSMEEVWVPEGPERWILHYQGNDYTYYSYRWWFRYYNTTHYDASGGGYEMQETCTEEVYSPVDEASLERCTYMKNHGVQIYSIAYDVADDSRTEWDERPMAVQFMKDCSSGEEIYYKYASTGADLQEVFEEIGEAVVKEVIRVKR